MKEEGYRARLWISFAISRTTRPRALSHTPPDRLQAYRARLRRCAPECRIVFTGQRGSLCTGFPDRWRIICMVSEIPLHLFPVVFERLFSKRLHPATSVTTGSCQCRDDAMSEPRSSRYCMRSAAPPDLLHLQQIYQREECGTLDFLHERLCIPHRLDAVFPR